MDGSASASTASTERRIPAGAARRAARAPLAVLGGQVRRNAHRLVLSAARHESSRAAAAADPDVRPICIGEVETRVISSIVTESFMEAFTNYLTPQQLAVGVGGGQSVLIHGVRMYIEQHPDHVVVRVDLKNAFNSGSRRHLYERLLEMAQVDPEFETRG